MTQFVIISKAEYERLKELEKRMNILVKGIEIQKSTFSHGLELLKRQKTLRYDTRRRNKRSGSILL